MNFCNEIYQNNSDFNQLVRNPIDLIKIDQNAKSFYLKLFENGQKRSKTQMILTFSIYFDQF